MPDPSPRRPLVRDGASAIAAEQVRQNGYAILPRLFTGRHIECVGDELDSVFARTRFSKGHFYGNKTKRFGQLARRCASVQDIIIHPVLLGIVAEFLGPYCDTLALNVAEAIAIHPDAPAQYPHRDADMWPAANTGIECCLNIIWPIDRFTVENGATRIWPRSHIGDRSSHPAAEPIVAVAEPGDAILILGSTLHGAGANRSGDRRRAIVIGYSLGWLRPYENPSLAYPPDVARAFAPELAALVGYCRHRPNLGNIDGQCPSTLLDGVPTDETLGATDGLLPAQAQALAAYTDQQIRSTTAGKAA
jgi:hypothetical protein